jgi:hypothetical protein
VKTYLINTKEMIKHWIIESSIEIWSFVIGTAMAALSFFLPIKEIVNLMFLFFFFDVLFGYWANRKSKGETFMPTKFWKVTAPRMLISLVMIILAFLWDEVYYNETFATYKILGGFISGVLLVSIAQNGYKITNWSLFILIAETVESQFKNIVKKGKKTE